MLPATQMEIGRVRAAPALLETKRLMEEFLPPVLARANTEFDLSIPMPKAYHLAGTKLGSQWPVVVVGFSVEMSPLALRVDQDHVHIACYMAYGQIESETQLLNCLDACYWMRNIVMAHRGAHFDPDGIVCWKGIETGGIQRAPQRFPDYEGLAYQFRAWQPGDHQQGRSYWKAD